MVNHWPTIILHNIFWKYNHETFKLYQAFLFIQNYVELYKIECKSSAEIHEICFHGKHKSLLKF